MALKQMEIFSVKKMEDIRDPYYIYDAYTVKVGSDHRILTIVTSSELTVTKWLKQAIKIRNNSCLPNKLVVGFSIELKPEYKHYFRVRHTCYYGLIILCIGAHCLIYLLYHPGDLRPKFLISFLENPRVVVVGMGIEAKASRLERDFRVKIQNAVDLNIGGKYDLDGLVLAVLGKDGVHVRFKKMTEWFKTSGELTDAKVLHSTADAHLYFRIAFKLYDMNHGSESKSNNNKKKGKK
ncbi:hypothetical protein F3Y22_tig00012385pilonHSYRG00007 [Hibiscus syriacus]|uniref:3'-5' exonuclease domain-containing protein n=1 Tax=Hibiscus syriacus TaxID=106335 RepID=A0A6A3C782_HIBSY|nr:Werner syndrome ATP-dependent helicase homolog [Hibiscus syriacus]KAE8723428.1 hypothetical protein F3Y22_tig00012385pilonHSYRG00007 [Hibiscus syriacus]